MRVATHCTEADISTQHIAAVRELSMDVAGFLMMSHMAEPAELSRQARLMKSYGATCVYATDSGGRLTMDGVRDRFRSYREVLSPDAELGIPPITTSPSAWPTPSSPSRATRSASTPRTPGWSAGNCPLEVFVAVADLRDRPAGHGRRPGGHDH